MTSSMAEERAACPQVFVVDSQARYLPPIPERQSSRKSKTFLYVLMILAFCGLAVEACFIYHLYTKEVTVDTTTAEKSVQDKSDVKVHYSINAKVKPLKPSAHLAGIQSLDGGSIKWISSGGDSFTHEMDYIEGKLFARKEGFYFIYSKVYSSEPFQALFTHSVLKSSPRLPGSDLELMRSRRSRSKTQWETSGGMLNSYLGGVFLLHEGDAVFVKVNNSRLLRQLSADNFFGVYML